MNNEPNPIRKYRVRVGHLELHVKAHDAAEAIIIARRKLGRELPRLYDVIRRLELDQFQVDHAA
jgi:hypothetical protein